MARTGKTLTIEEIIEMNRRQIELYGGSFLGVSNLYNERSLQYALDALDASVFGLELFPRVEAKAAFLAYSIISRHVFSDGNKRTGLTACRVFLLLHGIEFRIDDRDGFDEELVRIVQKVAQGLINLDAFTNFVMRRCQPAYPDD